MRWRWLFEPDYSVVTLLSIVVVVGIHVEPGWLRVLVMVGVLMVGRWLNRFAGEDDAQR
jgi:hypothetical protein